MEFNISKYNVIQNSYVGEMADDTIIIEEIENYNPDKEEIIDETSEEDIQEAINLMNKLLKKHDFYVKYEVHDKFKNATVIKFVDSKTKEVIKEMPPKKILDMVANMCELAGIMINKKA